MKAADAARSSLLIYCNWLPDILDGVSSAIIARHAIAIRPNRRAVAHFATSIHLISSQSNGLAGYYHLAEIISIDKYPALSPPAVSDISNQPRFSQCLFRPPPEKVAATVRLARRADIDLARMRHHAVDATSP